MKTLNGVKVLVVEDRTPLAMALCGMLQDNGCEIVGPTGLLSEAVALARDRLCDIGLIDIDLRGEPSFPVSDILSARGIPVVLVTGFATDSVPEPYTSLPVLLKPIEHDRLRECILQNVH